jgi:alpha-1,2-mannosyltransferase
MGRFTPEKRYETILEVAKRLPEVQFHLMGRVTSDKMPYLGKLMNGSPRNVVFHVNASVRQKTDVLKKSKVMLHSFIGEHFGIALVEAMSAGVIPLSHNSGAARVDCLIPESYRYDNVDGAVDRVSFALSSWDFNISQRLHQFAKRFSPQSFTENLKTFLLSWINQH